MSRPLALLFVATLLAACESSSSGDSGTPAPSSANLAQGSCFIPATATEACNTCEEFTGSTWKQAAVLQSLKQGCADNSKGTWSAEACTAANRVSRCVVDKGKDSEKVFVNYSPCKAADLQLLCSSLGGFFE